ncbi:MAG: dihydrodipicolinate synthase family protein [Gemmatimonadota bacterium]
MELNGILIPAATPFDPVTGELDLVGLRSNLRRWMEHPVRGIVFCGSTGEAVLLDDDERFALIEGGRELIPEDRLMVVGTGAESTRATIRNCRVAAGCGADAVLVQPPAFYKGQMTDAVLRDHYTAVADGSPVPVVLYQVPLRFSTLDLGTGLVSELSTHENVIGIKDSRGDLGLVGDLVERTRKGFQVLVGNGARLYASLEIGAVGAILGIANLVPGESAALHRAFTEGRTGEAGRLQERVAPVHDQIVGAFGVAGVKAALDRLGYRGGDPRAPLRPLDDAGRTVVHAVLAQAGVQAGSDPA